MNLNSKNNHFPFYIPHCECSMLYNMFNLISAYYTSTSTYIIRNRHTESHLICLILLWEYYIIINNTIIVVVVIIFNNVTHSIACKQYNKEYNIIQNVQQNQLSVWSIVKTERHLVNVIYIILVLCVHCTYIQCL